MAPHLAALVSMRHVKCLAAPSEPVGVNEDLSKIATQKVIDSKCLEGNGAKEYAAPSNRHPKNYQDNFRGHVKWKTMIVTCATFISHQPVFPTESPAKPKKEPNRLKIKHIFLKTFRLAHLETWRFKIQFSFEQLEQFLTVECQTNKHIYKQTKTSK